MKISYEYICSKPDDIPQQAIEHLDGQIVRNTGASISELFPQFCNTFKLTSEVLIKTWTKPKLALKLHRHLKLNQWLSFIVVQTNNKNLFFDLRPNFLEKEGEEFEESHQMLPDGWKELYRWFNSFMITEESYCPMDWWNTPFSYEARLDLDDYEDGSGATRQKTEQFAKKIGCRRESLRCWLLTENEDALFINEEVSDGRVYHVQGKNLEVVTELSHPTETLDRYLAHVVSGRSPVEFSFINLKK